MRIFILFMIGLATQTIHAQSVKTDYDTQTDFSKFKTYAWLAPGDSVLNRERIDKVYGGTITHAANQELTARGLKLTSENPDAILMFLTSVHEVTTYSQSPTLSVGVGVAGPGYYVGGSAPVAGGKITASTSEDGTLKYMMYDTGTGKLVWSGMVQKSFKMSDDIQQLLRDNTVKIFKKLPLKPVKK